MARDTLGDAAGMHIGIRHRLRRPSGPADRNPLSRGDRIGLRIILLLATAYGLGVVVIGVISFAAYLPAFSGGPATLTVFANGNLPAAGMDGPATLLSGTVTEAFLRVEGISGSAAGLLTSAQVVGSLTELAVIAAVAFLALRLLRGSPFLRSMTITAAFASAAVIVGGVGEQALRGFGQMQVVSELSRRVESTALDSGFAVDFAPLGIGFALAVVATAFQVAERLQRDTDGLV